MLISLLFFPSLFTGRDYNIFFPMCEFGSLSDGMKGSYHHDYIHFSAERKGVIPDHSCSGLSSGVHCVMMSMRREVARP